MTHNVDDMRTTPEIHHVNLPVLDPIASAEWYSQVLGYERERDFTSDGVVTGVALRHPGGGVRLVLRASTEVTHRSVDLAPIAYSVRSTADLQSLAARLERDDIGDVELQPATSGAVLTFNDPDGHQILIYSLEE